MVFSSIEFLFLFLPVVLGLYWITPQRAKNTLLLAASLVFYTWGGGAFVLILLLAIALNYAAGLLIGWARDHDRPLGARLGLALGVVTGLGLLGYFKYANFLIDQLNDVGRRLGLGTIAWEGVALPIGISFFTFQAMSYVVDVYRGRTRRLANPIDFAMYVALFPQLIAGPIVRFHEISDQLRDRRSRMDDIADGVLRFAHGLVKKVVVADAVAAAADAAFGAQPGLLSMPEAWFGLAAYTLQIYFDFSGYSDMAIGLGRMLGFRLPENFRRPYSAISITDFWRRWHMTLSNWFRDYLYVPLGGNRGSRAATYRNLAIVFLLTGLWHGAKWTFVAWGAYHGVLLIVERASGQRPTGDASLVPLRRALTLLAVMLGWVLFRADSFPHALGYLQALFSFDFGAGSGAVAAASSGRLVLTLALAGLVVLLPRDFVFGTYLLRPRRGAVAARLAVLALALPYALLLVVGGSFSPFLYFQF
jgi:alginate O-acetyltransferase complex protein AlgI